MLWVAFSETNYLTNSNSDTVETLLSFKNACKLAVLVPDYKIAI